MTQLGVAACHDWRPIGGFLVSASLLHRSAVAHASLQTAVTRVSANGGSPGALRSFHVPLTNGGTTTTITSTVKIPDSPVHSPAIAPVVNAANVLRMTAFHA